MAIRSARAAGAEVLVEPFNDPIGKDAVIQFPGGVKMQLYWHFTPPSYAPLRTNPDNRVYLSKDSVDAFVRSFNKFSNGGVTSDDRQCDAGEIGRPNEKIRCIEIESLLGNFRVFVTDGHLPYPFGGELMGYEVSDLNATLEKAKTSGAKILSPPYSASDRTSAMIEIPGGYIAEIHSFSKKN